jgi:hypothetical protein
VCERVCLCVCVVCVCMGLFRHRYDARCCFTFNGSYETDESYKH